MIGVYKIQHPSGVYYIGQTGDLQRRKAEHERMLRGNRHAASKLQEAFNADPTLTWSIDETIDVDEAMALEEYYLTLNFGDPNLANKLGNGFINEAAKQASNRKQSDETISKRVSKITGQSRSNETRAQMSNSHKESPVARAHLAALHEKSKRQVTVSGVTYPSVKEAAAAFNIKPCTVLQRINSNNFEDWSY